MAPTNPEVMMFEWLRPQSFPAIGPDKNAIEENFYEKSLFRTRFR